jgi:hypothetical protein
VQTAIRPDDRAGGRGPVDAPVVGGTPVSSPGDGFDWTDGAIGAATASGVLLLLSGGAAVLMLRRRGRVAL